jgi:hypothetical protein
VDLVFDQGGGHPLLLRVDAVDVAALSVRLLPVAVVNLLATAAGVLYFGG